MEPKPNIILKKLFRPLPDKTNTLINYSWIIASIF